MTAKMEIKWETFEPDGYSAKEGLKGTYNGTVLDTEYTDYPIFMLLAKIRIWMRFRILN
jgi:hypothetical protein